MNANAETLIQVKDLCKAYGDKQILKGISLDIHRGDEAVESDESFLAFFAFRHERLVKMLRNRDPKKESASFQPDNDIEFDIFKHFVERFERKLQTIGITENPRDIAKKNPRLRKIRNRDNVVLNSFHSFVI